MTIRHSPRSINLPVLSTPIIPPRPHSRPQTVEPSSPDSPSTPTASNYFALSHLSGRRRSRSASCSSRSPPPLRARPSPSRAEGGSSETLSDEITSRIRVQGESARMSRTPSNALKRKVIIMGSPSVGKTSLTQQYIAPPTYTASYFPTIEATSHKIVSYEGQDYDCEIIDSAGQDEYTLFPPKYAVGVHGYLLVYSIASRQSFDMICTVHEKILDFAGLEKVPCVIVGQKCDLAEERRVSTAEGQALAAKMKGGFVESSAKDNKNVGRVFEALLQEMRKEYNPAPEVKKKGWFSWGS